MWSHRKNLVFATVQSVLIVGLPGLEVHAADVEEIAYRIHRGATVDDMVGWSVASLGDVTGDGVPDYVIGAPGVGPFFEGHAYIHSGASGNIYRDLTIGSEVADMGGFSVDNAGDVNGDGRDDVIVGAPFSSLGKGFARVYASNGQILHTIHGTISNALTGYSVCGVGDINDDGRSDFAVSTPYSGGGVVTVHSGMDESPLFTWTGTGKFGYVIAGVGDINGNGYPDLAVSALTSGRVHLFDPHDHVLFRTLVGTTAVRYGKTLGNAGDVNADGVNDVIVGFDNGAFVYDGASDNILHAFLNGLGSTVAGVGDVDGDGYGDIAIGDAWTAQPRNGKVEIRSGFDGSKLRVFSRVLAADDEGPRAAGLGDINGDGLSDILIGANVGPDDHGAAYVVLGGPNVMSMYDGGLYPAFVSYPTFSISANIDNKKNADMLTVNGVTNRLYVQMNKGDGTFQFPKQIVTGENPTSVAPIDIDGDGDQDVLVACAGDNKVRVYGYYNNSLIFIGGIKTGGWPSSVVSDDFNRDGYPDFAVANRDDDTVTVFLHNKSTIADLNKRFIDGRNYAVGHAPAQLIVGRFDDDQYPDLALSYESTSQISLLTNKKNGRFGPHQVSSIDAPAVGMRATDVDGDELTDLSWVDPAANLVIVSRALGGGVLEAPASYPTGAQPTSVAFLDMNLDGLLDLAVGNVGENSVSILIQTAGGVFVPSMTIPTVISPECMTTLDADADDDTDLAVVGGSIGITNLLHNGWY